MLLLTGEYEHVIDDKGRLSVPNKLRSQIDIDEYGPDFYLVLGANGILYLYPEKNFQQIALAVALGKAAPDETVIFRRMSLALAGKVELDRQGRLLLNDKLRKRARLGDNVPLIGVGDHIELWNTKNWEEFVSEHMDEYQKQMMQAHQDVLQRQSKELEY